MEPNNDRTRLPRGMGLVAPGTLVASLACGGDTARPATVASVEVTSPIGSLLDVGGGAQLAAAAKDAQGSPVGGVTVTWTSSPGIVSVTPGGRIEALAVGTATISAEAGGVRGALAVRVVDADLAGILANAVDAYVLARVGATTAEMRTRLEAATTSCLTGAQQGNLELIQSCIAAVRAEVANATNPTDRVLLAVVELFVDQIERLLNL